MKAVETSAPAETGLAAIVARPAAGLRFLALFAACYLLLVAPWPGWDAAYGRCFRGLSRLAFGRETGRMVVRFRPAERPPRPEIDTEILCGDRSQVDADGNGPVRVLGLDTRGVGWVPTALFLALAAASPLPWRRRALVLLVGAVAMHFYLLGTVAAYLWQQSGGLTPVAWLPYWPPLGAFLEETLVTQMGPGLTAAVIVWLGATAWIDGNAGGVGSTTADPGKGPRPSSAKKKGRR